ncbi:hypothetical protein K469DRAFT_223309 [Zopfia rhizophila CBS 207.26]|uniref:SprT-like domain-containing protein n=1 Tax=Zopfia rhizophila CBS 207.26 TaxID=1314779 RepID=A0A6A6DVW7_9PEZI|nr:hypothetical protein K469DRAFT_223309 [Zopfia rhizophila CBS 207.26]
MHRGQIRARENLTPLLRTILGEAESKRYQQATQPSIHAQSSGNSKRQLLLWGSKEYAILLGDDVLGERGNFRRVCRLTWLVQLYPNAPDKMFGPAKYVFKVERLGTLLHELVHTFLCHFPCTSGRTYEVHADYDHGRALQLIVRAIGNVTPQLHSQHVDLGRLTSLCYDLENRRELPSNHDLELYGFS